MLRTVSRDLLIVAAKQAVEAAGYQIERQPGRGLSNVWNLIQGRSTKTASVRTSRNRWVAFPPLDGGKRWKTLDDVDLVVVATVNDKDHPEQIEVFLFTAKEVRQRFDDAYRERANAGNSMRDDFGLWVALDEGHAGKSLGAGSGLAAKHKPIKVYSLDEIASLPKKKLVEGIHRQETISQPHLSTIADVMAWARSRLSELAGVPLEAIKLDLKIES